MSDKIEGKQVKYYTYGEYLTWQDENRYELIDGVPYMLLAPTWQHQSILGQMILQFGLYLKEKECRVFGAPFDLRLPEGNNEDEASKTVLQPDVVIVCDRQNLRKTGYFGIPSLVIEITSPSTSKRDKLVKFNKYEKAGVKEYWIIEPKERLVSVFTLQENGRYGRPDIYTDGDKIQVSIFSDLIIDLSFLKEL